MLAEAGLPSHPTAPVVLGVGPSGETVLLVPCSDAVAVLRLDWSLSWTFLIGPVAMLLPVLLAAMSALQRRISVAPVRPTRDPRPRPRRPVTIGKEA